LSARPNPGIAVGLAWTATGGEILFVEATQDAGSGPSDPDRVTWDVMKESVQAALSFVRSHTKQLNIEAKLFDRSDFHVHVPAAAIPKGRPVSGRHDGGGASVGADADGA